MKTKYWIAILSGAFFASCCVLAFVILHYVDKYATPDDTDYLSTVKAQAPSLIYFTDNQLVSFGKTACQGFEAGDDKYRIAEVISTANSMSVQQAGTIIEAAVPVYCSKFKGKL